MLLIKGYHNIKFGKVFRPKRGLPYIEITIIPESRIIEAGSVIWDPQKKQWELRTRKEARELVKEMGEN